MMTIQKPTLRLLLLFLTVAWAGVLYYLSDQPGIDRIPLFLHQDKLLHFIAYGLLGFLAMGATRTSGQSNSIRQLWLIVLLAGLYGISDEIHQSFVSGRDSSVYDFAADLAGGMAGAWLMYYLLKTLPARSSGFPPSRE